MALLTPETVTITSAQHQEPLIFRYSTMILSDGRTRYEGTSAENALTLTLERGQCLDTMSGEQFGWAAQAVINGMIYHGCAKKGDL
ncbi:MULTISPECIES: hypothetical protein [unclassified Pseudodesulfovibrio]|uniref:hypothetical protein n=1 Tax=unclassified Pseudodesulfovibrio TaxID=2661612 RepID=UPI000FEBFCEB|nr:MULTISPECIES: hypothetical protein [unclassified Pseudodesulfovibrio]MCJ2163768.1 hypothetical protein [Pseudodesulfovibrio sp. S3-i]RWU05983.1 hypothetical protein DWB63_04730 [Pseudodesulfovibrio sp. S3]